MSDHISDNSALPFIDFKRDTPEVIQDKLRRRSAPHWTAPTEQPSAIPVGGSLVHPDDAAKAGAAIGPNFNPVK